MECVVARNAAQMDNETRKIPKRIIVHTIFHSFSFIITNCIYNINSILPHITTLLLYESLKDLGRGITY